MKNWTQDVVVGVFLIVVGVFSFPVGVGGRGFLDTQMCRGTLNKSIMNESGAAEKTLILASKIKQNHSI